MAGGPPPPEDVPAAIPPEDPAWPVRPILAAAAAAGAGRVADARAALAGWRMSALPELHDLEWVVVAAVGVTAAGTERQRADCYARLAPYAGSHVVVGGCAAYYGPVDHHLGLLAAALGRTADAAAHRRAALAASERLGTPAWTATISAVADGAPGLPPPQGTPAAWATPAGPAALAGQTAQAALAVPGVVSVDIEFRTQIVAHDVPYISLWHRTNFALSQPPLQGIHLSPQGDFTFLRNVSR